MFDTLRHSFQARSRAAVATAARGLQRMMVAWVLLVAVACGVRVATSPTAGAPASGTWLGYLLICAAPVGTMAAGLRFFGREPNLGSRAAQADAARYRPVAVGQALRHPAYGPSGIMVTLLAGLLISIALRTFAYLAALPALAADVPAWLSTLQFALTVDVVLFSSLYALAFAAALRCAPVFPILLAAIWVGDLTMQLGMSAFVADRPDLPDTVRMALRHLIDGNIAKVVISAALWMPYLLLSTRVNITYRRRISADC
jgi:hypothetical protein